MGGRNLKIGDWNVRTIRGDEQKKKIIENSCMDLISIQESRVKFEIKGYRAIFS